MSSAEFILPRVLSIKQNAVPLLQFFTFICWLLQSLHLVPRGKLYFWMWLLGKYRIFSKYWDTLTLYSIRTWGGGRVWRRCCVSYVTGASNWYWLPLFLQQVRVEGGMFLFLLSSLSFIFLILLCLSLSSPLFSSFSLLPFSSSRHKMAQKGWRIVKPQHNQSILLRTWTRLSFSVDLSRAMLNVWQTV